MSFKPCPSCTNKVGNATRVCPHCKHVFYTQPSWMAVWRREQKKKAAELVELERRLPDGYDK